MDDYFRYVNSCHVALLSLLSLHFDCHVADVAQFGICRMIQQMKENTYISFVKSKYFVNK